MSDLSIQLATQATFPQLLSLIADYQRFYRVEPNEARNAAFFGELLQDSSLGLQLVALEAEAKVVGFATLYLTRSSLQAKVACVLNDLFVPEAHRGQGIARRLMARALVEAKARGITHLEWMTQTSNVTAQRLYEQLGAESSPWYAYSLGVDHPLPPLEARKARHD